MNNIQETFAGIAEKTSRLEAEFLAIKNRLEESYATLESAISHISDGFILISSEGKILIFNKAAEIITCYKQQELQDKPYSEFFSDTLFGFSMQKALTEGEKKRNIYLTLHNGKKEHHLEVSFSEIRGKGLMLILRDKTEMRKLKQALSRNDRLKELGEMAARLAHEIRNPLGGIEGFATLLLRDLQEDPPRAKMAQSIIEGTGLLNRLVTSVLHYARPLQVHFTKQDLVQLIKEVIALATTQEKEGRTCCFLTEEKTLLVTIDKELFSMALLNILKNGLEATPAFGMVKITLFRERKKICIAVKDDGEGIAKDNLERIFTPFFTTKAEGTGLGLSEAYKMIEAHGGKLSVQSEEKKGTTFTIKFMEDYGD